MYALHQNRVLFKKNLNKPFHKHIIPYLALVFCGEAAGTPFWRRIAFIPTRGRRRRLEEIPGRGRAGPLPVLHLHLACERAEEGTCVPSTAPDGETLCPRWSLEQLRADPCALHTSAPCDSSGLQVILCPGLLSTHTASVLAFGSSSGQKQPVIPEQSPDVAGGTAKMD